MGASDRLAYLALDAFFFPRMHETSLLPPPLPLPSQPDAPIRRLPTMALFQSVFARLSRKSMSVVATNVSLACWCQQLHTRPTRFAQKSRCAPHFVRMKMPRTPLGKDHRHMGVSSVLTHRSLCLGGYTPHRMCPTYHSVDPIAESFRTGSTLFCPDIHDCIYQYC